jgi:hypothetical protein
MKTSTFEKGIPMLPRLGLCLAVLLGALAVAGGCGIYSEGAEGDRCDPLRSSDECNSGLHCSGNPIGISASYPIAFCPENYCCPTTVTASDNAYCQPGCNGGAAAICTADPTNAAACAFSSCAADAADPENCPLDGGASEDSAAPGEGGSDDAAPEASTPAPEASAPEGGDASQSD